MVVLVPRQREVGPGGPHPTTAQNECVRLWTASTPRLATSPGLESAHTPARRHHTPAYSRTARWMRKHYQGGVGEMLPLLRRACRRLRQTAALANKFGDLTHQRPIPTQDRSRIEGKSQQKPVQGVLRNRTSFELYPTTAVLDGYLCSIIVERASHLDVTVCRNGYKDGPLTRAKRFGHSRLRLVWSQQCPLTTDCLTGTIGKVKS
jgi:hypothetical protein